MHDTDPLLLAGFLYYLTRSKQSPPLTLFGFYFLLVFVFGTIPAGIYGELFSTSPARTLLSGQLTLRVLAAAKTHYGTILANVDWLHGSAESLLTVTNLLIGTDSKYLFAPVHNAPPQARC